MLFERENRPMQKIPFYSELTNGRKTKHLGQTINIILSIKPNKLFRDQSIDKSSSFQVSTKRDPRSPLEYLQYQLTRTDQCHPKNKAECIHSPSKIVWDTADRHRNSAYFFDISATSRPWCELWNTVIGASIGKIPRESTEIHSVWSIFILTLELLKNGKGHSVAHVEF
jgi:hypothetical protein